MLDAAGAEAGRQAGVAAARLRIRVVVRRHDVEVAVLVHRLAHAGRADGNREDLPHLAVAIPRRDVAGEVVGEVIFQARHDGAVALRQSGAGVEVDVSIRRRGQFRHVGLPADLRAEVLDHVFLVDGVGRPAQARAAIVDTQGAHVQALRAVLQRGFTAALDAIEAQAPGIVFAKAAAQVKLAGEVGLAGIAQRGARQWFVVGALGHHVDGAADAAIGRNAAHEGAGALQHFHPLQDLHRHAAGRHQAIQAVDADVAAAHGKAANLEVFTKAAGRGQRADRGVVHDHVGQRAGLLVIQQFRGVVDRAERRIHHVFGPQQTQAAARGKLPAGIGRGKLAQNAGRYRHGFQLHRAAHGLGARQGHVIAIARVLDARALQQLAQRLFRRQIARDGARILAGQHILRIKDLQGRLRAQLQQRIAQGLRGNVDADGRFLGLDGGRHAEDKRQ
ncbi:hypothetical protein D3C73_877100 [compost metagenome]